jgi:hypothetical protein
MIGLIAIILYYGRVSATGKWECADSNSWPNHGGMTGQCRWRMPVHLHRLEGAQTELKAAWWSIPVLLYALLFLLYALFVFAEQDCSPCKYVLCTAFRCTPTLCVKTSLWIIGGDAIAVKCAQTVTIIAIMSTLLQLLFQLYALFHNQKSHLGLELCLVELNYFTSISRLLALSQQNRACHNSV